ncbi:MAG: 23S rRNA (adenine(2503)-C(2))-methyltransferase RlmN [Alphaproteobacteria bacterium]|jgi:23S rRNA (adenine2503-C2)-methyltransferase|nr:23S rRNA (adenine(2503)-C(2))-methyltransferase RlmN [Alphaproteobacteria bacterium]MDP6566401.1 23S rRNA (adenine(2503)-C(2))-methyltransferase RlmN [Alphaproteobacteria bacterium]MDP6811641.1 23S rRNA (adenine(2503)-C(2))-methyltransferase RlmN [Alphaproteobacteria bacterium]
MAQTDSDRPTPLIGLSRPQLLDLLADLGVPERQRNMRVRQLWRWLYNRGVRSFDEMTDLGKDLRAALRQRHAVGRPDIATALKSTDGTAKWLFRLADGNEVESVHIPDQDRGALCMSSQIGCSLNCRFCHTGTQAMVRNLTPGEIVGQLLAARDALGEWPTPEGNRQISTIVMMGMGEPLLNFDNVAQALNLIMDMDGIAFSRRSITLSTAGVVPAMDRCGRELRVNLAVSLHAVRDEIRDELVPLNRRYPIADLLRACRDYPAASNARRITFEYVMLKDVNDSLADARELVRLIRGIPGKINLIPFNPWPGAPYECSSNNQIHRFAKLINDAGYSAPIRTPRGRDIMAACGQLKSASQRPPRRAAAAAS